MKREADNDMGGGPQKRTRRGDEEVRFLIPSKAAGSIIGKGGQNISKLRSQYKASITVPDCSGPERLLSLSSDLETICNIINDVIPNLKDNEGKNGNQIDLRMLIHQSQAGCIIGKSGSKIKELRDKTGARIKIFSNVAPQSTDRVIQIVGTGDQCVETVREAILLIKQSPIKGMSNPYNPHNFDEFYAEEYGGWGSGGGAGNKTQPRRFVDFPGGDSFRGDNRNGPSQRTGRDGPPNSIRGFPPRGFSSPPPSVRTGGLGGSPPGLSGGLQGGSFGGNRRFSDTPRAPRDGPSFGSRANVLGARPIDGPNGKNTAQVTIPKDLAGAIIGKGGQRIRKIRQDSGASITIDEPLPGSNDRIITISGEPNQIQMAQYLLQQRIRGRR